MREFLFLVLLVFYPTFCVSQAPFEPLRRPEERVGQYSWGLAVAYTPMGWEGMGIDELGRPYSYTVFLEEWRLTLSGAVQLATGLKTGMKVSNQTLNRREIRRYPAEEQRLSSTGQEMAYAWFCEYRLDPTNPWDPRASVSLGYPWKGGAGLSWSLLRDPMVLLVELSFRAQDEEPWSWFFAGLSAGFVANQWISMSASANVSVPVLGIGVPVTSLGIRLRYALDLRGNQEVGVRTTLTLRGDRTWLGIEMEWLGQGF